MNKTVVYILEHNGKYDNECKNVPSFLEAEHNSNIRLKLAKAYKEGYKNALEEIQLKEDEKRIKEDEILVENILSRL